MLSSKQRTVSLQRASIIRSIISWLSNSRFSPVTNGAITSYAVGSTVFAFLAFLVEFVFVETYIILLTDTLRFVHCFDRAFVVWLHTVRKPSAITSAPCTPVSIPTIDQISRTHWPTELRHYIVDLLEICAVFYKKVKCTEVREQYTVNQESWAVIYNDWCFTHF